MKVMGNIGALSSFANLKAPLLNAIILGKSISGKVPSGKIANENPC